MSKLYDKCVLSMVQPYDNWPTFWGLNWSFIAFYEGFIFFWKKYFRNGKLLHGKMAQFFAFSRISVFAHVISPATDILGFFIFAFSMQNFNFPYISFPLKKNAISGVWAVALYYSISRSIKMFFWHTIWHGKVNGHEMTIFHNYYC